MWRCCIFDLNYNILGFIADIKPDIRPTLTHTSPYLDSDWIQWKPAEEETERLQQQCLALDDKYKQQYEMDKKELGNPNLLISM